MVFQAKVVEHLLHPCDDISHSQADLVLRICLEVLLVE